MAITTVSSHVVSVNAIQGTLIADNAITAVHIATNAVSGTLIADNAITAVHVAQNSITVTQLADDCVESDKIADGVITTNHLNKAMISSQTEVTPVAGDFVLLGDTSDSNNLKKAAVSSLAPNSLPLAGGTMTGALVVGGNITSSGDFINTKAGGDLQFNGGSTGYIKSTTSLALDFDSDNNQTGMDFKVTHNGGTQLLKIDNSGKATFSAGASFVDPVSIGTTSANQRLEVGGSGANIYLGNNSADTNFIHTGGCLGLSADTDVYITCDSNDTSNDPAPAGTIIFGGGSNTDTDSNLDFTEAEFGNNGAPRVEYGRFHSNGFFGVNTIPGVELDIKRKTNAYPFRIGSTQGQGRAMVFADVHASPTKYNWLVGAQYNVDNAFEITPSTAVGGYTFTGGTGITVTQAGKVGIGETAPLGHLHVKDGDSGMASVNANFDKLVLEDSSHSGMTILGGANTHGAIYFGDPNSNDIGQMKYKHDSDSMAFTQSGHETVLLTHTGAHFKGLNSYTLTINADTDNSGEDGVPTLDFKMDGSQTRLKMGVDASNLPYISTQSDIALPLQIQTGVNGYNRVYIDDTGMQIRNGSTGAGAPNHLLELVHSGTSDNDQTFISIINGTGTGDISTPESHIDFEFFDSNTNEYPQARITAGASTAPGVDANTQSLEGKGYIAFATNDGSGTSGEVDPINRVVITGDGDLLSNTTTAVGSMYNGVSGIGFGYSSGGYGAFVRSGTNTPLYVSTTSQGSGGFISFSQNGATRGDITYNGSSTLYNASSDYRLKENATPIANALTKIGTLKPITFDWKESGDTSDGFLAHEIQAVLPYMVTGVKDEVYTDENSGEEKTNGQPKYQTMDYSKLTPLLVKAIQEQQTIIEDLKTRIETLEG